MSRENQNFVRLLATMAVNAAGLIGSEPPGYQIPAAFRLDRIDGLISVEVLRSVDADDILARFVDRDRALTREPELRKALGLREQLRLFDVVGLKAKRELWPTTLYARIERVVAAAGILLAIANYGGVFFAAPNVSVRVRELQDVVEGQPAETTLELFSHGDTSAQIDAGTDFAATVTPPALTLAARGQGQILVKTNAPVLKEEMMVVLVTARAGWFRFAQNSPTRIRLVPWPKIYEEPPTLLKVSADGRTADVAATLRLGVAAPKGLFCEARLRKAPGINFDGATPIATMTPPKLNTDAGIELAAFTMETAPAAPFKPFPLVVYLRSKVPHAEDEWSSIAKRVVVVCPRRLE